jgi:hypothetical protein
VLSLPNVRGYGPPLTAAKCERSILLTNPRHHDVTSTFVSFVSFVWADDPETSRDIEVKKPDFD